MFEVVTSATESGGDAGDGLDSLMERARRGEIDVLPQLRAALDAADAIRERAGDLASIAERAWIALIAGEDVAFGEALARKVVVLAAEIAGLSPSPLEKLLTQRVVAAWLMASHADAAYAQNAAAWSNKQATCGLDRMDRASRRLNAAIAALASLRKLLPGGSKRGKAIASPGFHGEAEVGPMEPRNSAPAAAEGNGAAADAREEEPGGTIDFEAARRKGSPCLEAKRGRARSRAKRS